MLDSVFVSILDLTKVSSLVILAVIAARLLLKRAPKVISYALWAVVLLRLLVPMEIQSPVSMLPELKPTTQSYALEDEPISAVNAGIAAYQAVGDVLNGGIGTQHVPTDRVDEAGNVEYVVTDFEDVWILFGSYLWAVGVVGLAGYSLFSILKLKRKLREAMRLEDGVYLAESIDSPFVMGMLHPRIYLPQGLTDGERSYILAHERHHIRRLDPLWKALGFAALCIHWFNPLVWLAFSRACRDMEMSCDEAVLKTMGGSIRSDYAASLLKIATGHKAIVGGPLAFGEGDPKGRIKNLARWKKPVIWLSILAVIVCIVLAVCLLTDPIKENVPNDPELTPREQILSLIDALVATPGTDPDACLDANPEIYQQLLSFNALTANVMLDELETESQDSYRFKVMEAWLERNREYWSIGTVEDQVGAILGTYQMLGMESVFQRIDGVREKDGKWYYTVTFGYYENGASNEELTEWFSLEYSTFETRDVDGDGVVEMIAVVDSKRQPYHLYDIEDGAIVVQKLRRKPTETTEKTQSTTEKVYGFDMSKVPNDGSLPIEELPTDYKREAAIRDGALIIENDTVYANDEVWTAFLNKVEAGEPARIRIVFYSLDYLDGMRDVLFDGEYYRLRNAVYYSDGNLSHVQEQVFYQLVKHQGENAYNDGMVYETYTQYYLALNNAFTRDPRADWSFYEGMSAVLIYRKSMTDYQTPSVPETLTSAKLMLEEKVLGEVKGTGKLESLRDLLANAQKTGEGSSWNYEDFYILLTGADGSQLRISIAMETDTMLLDGSFYDYGPGRRMNEYGEAKFYNGILELARHFGLEDWPEAVREYCLKRGWEPPMHSLAVLSGEEEHG